MNSIPMMSAGPNNSRSRRIAALLPLLLFSAGVLWFNSGRAADPAAIGPASATLSARYPAGSILSLEVAEHALVEAGQERTGIEARYAADERACYPKFFATACLDRAKERRRIGLARVRPVELEANSFKRRFRVVERDQALVEERAREDAEAPQRRKDQIEHEARLANKAAIEAAGAKPGDAGRERNQDSAAKRISQHESKLKRLQMEDAANAKKRAENVAAYEKKVRDAELHRREVAARKADKQRASSAPETPVPPAACCIKP